MTRALREGDLPADHNVLAGAVRCGALAEDYYRRASRGLSAQVITVVLLAVVGIASFFLSDPRHGALWLVMATLVTVLTVRREQLRIKLNTHLGQLRAAADASPDITTADLAPPPLPRRTRWQIVLFVVVVGATGIGFTALANRPRRDCSGADATMRLVADRPNLIDPQLLVTGGGDIRAYQDWADQLSGFADEVSAPDIAPHIRAIADRARDAVSLVAQARSTLPPRRVVDLQIAFGQDWLAIIDEEQWLTSACHPR